MLGVSRPRITQMIKSGRLKGYTKGHATFVTRASVEERLLHPPVRYALRAAAAG